MYLPQCIEHSVPPTALATLVTAQHFRPFQAMPMIFPPVLLFSSYLNLSGYKTDAAGITVNEHIKVPATIEAMANWAYIGPRVGSPDQTRKHTLLYTSITPRDPTPRRVQVTMRCQGFVEHINIQPVGNWKQCVISYFLTEFLFIL